MSIVNVLLSSFPGLPLPRTLAIPFPSTDTVADLTERLDSVLPPGLSTNRFLVLTTTSNQQLEPESSEQLSDLVQNCNYNSNATLLPLRLSARLCGGKGGFGSQLRAAGGRMSSRKKGNQGENNGSNRNLDGRRVRTVNEAKALAEYLSVKPDMEKKEKEARRKRWEMVVDAAERREEELRNGEGKGKLDGAWMEDKEEVGDKTREAVLRAMKDGVWNDNLAGDMVGGSSSNASEGSGNGSAHSASPSEDSDMEDVEQQATGSSSKVTAKPAPARKFFGFDEDDEELLSDEEDEVDEESLEPNGDVKVKGKEKA